MTLPHTKSSILLQYMPTITNYILVACLVLLQKWDVTVFVWNLFLQLPVLLILMSVKSLFLRLHKSFDGRPLYERLLGKMWIPLILWFFLYVLTSNMVIFNRENPLTPENQKGLLVSISIFTLSQLLSRSFTIFWKAADEIKHKIILREIINFAGRWTFVFILGAFAATTNAFSGAVIMAVVILISLFYEIYFTRILQKQS